MMETIAVVALVVIVLLLVVAIFNDNARSNRFDG